MHPALPASCLSAPVEGSREKTATASLKNAASAQRPAKVINIASIDGISVNAWETYSYAASKAGLIHLTKRMALRTRPIWSRRNVTSRDQRK